MRSSGTSSGPSPQSERSLVSIGITNYNYGRYLRAAIDGALAQTYPHLEVIVVDDGSTDDSREIIESYGKRIMPIFKGNGGHGSAVNVAFVASHGEIVMFLDSDDELLPDAVDQVVKAWRPGVTKVQFQLEMVDERSRPLGRLVPPFDGFIPNGDIRDRISRFGEYPSSPSSGNAYARSVLERLLPLDETAWFAAAEKSLVYLAPFFGDVVSLRMPLGRYRIHEANDSGLKGRHLQALHRRLSASFFIPETLCRVAASKGINLDLDAMSSTSRELKLRVASIRLDPKTHPVAGDTRLGLLIKGIRATLREPDMSVIVRVKQSVWFVLMATAPMAVVNRVASPER
jgi:glycosyltransferase involved in cell wall biosynthesis